jgi:SAM-dependent methyltransferase
LEIGSGSGEQLNEFKKLGYEVLGIEPSEKLSKYANSIGVKTITSLFDENTSLSENYFDVVVSSYTFDHIPQPIKALQHIYKILKDNGLLVIEVHDFTLIKERNEYCLFEHEHYIYLDKSTASNILALCNFELLSFDLLNEKRANSLIFVARKTKKHQQEKITTELNIANLDTRSLSARIYQTISCLEEWLEKNNKKRIVAYGAGGRGVMMLAAIKNPERILYAVDKNPKGFDIFMPKSHIPVFGLQRLKEEKADLIIVFSYGYFDEITKDINSIAGDMYKRENIISILDIIGN